MFGQPAMKEATLTPTFSKSQLVNQYVGKSIEELRSPALLVDRQKFKQNCHRIYNDITAQGLAFRAHVKTHKTAEGTRLQVEPGVKAVIASTLPEVWGIINEGLVSDGLVNDILYALPVDSSKLEELASCQEACGDAAVIRVMVDHHIQINHLTAFSETTGRQLPWLVFCKVDGGGKRAGAPPESAEMRSLIESARDSPSVEIFGFYSHFGQSYGSKSSSEANDFYLQEIECVNTAAKVARDLGVTSSLVLSVGATPTAIAAATHAAVVEGLEGQVEVHAGCYCMLDLQQLAVGVPRQSDVSISVLARVVSVYPDRKEAMCDAGALAVSKDTGQYPGFGRVVSPSHLTDWDLGRVSQEHGTLVHRQGSSVGDGAGAAINIGDIIRIVPQHACLACACYPWLYVIDGDKVVDVWIPWRGW